MLQRESDTTCWHTSRENTVLLEGITHLLLLLSTRRCNLWICAHKYQESPAERLSPHMCARRRCECNAERRTIMKSSTVLLNSWGSLLRASLKYCTNSSSSTVPFLSCVVRENGQRSALSKGVRSFQRREVSVRSVVGVVGQCYRIEACNHTRVLLLGPGARLLSQLPPRLATPGNVSFCSCDKQAHPWAPCQAPKARWSPLYRID